MKKCMLGLLLILLSVFTYAQKANYMDLYNKGKVLLEKNRIDSAALLFNKCIELKSDFGSAYYQIGNCFFQQKQYDSALINYNMAIARDSSFAVFYQMKGAALYEMKKYTASISALNICLQKDAKNAQALYTKAMCYYQQNNLEKSVPLMKQVLVLDEKNAKANKNLGSILYKEGKFAESVAYFEKAVSSEPFNIELLNVLAVCYEKIGLSDKANDTYRIIEKYNPQDPFLELSIAENKINQRDYVGARSIYFSALASFEDKSMVYNYIANTYFNEQKYDSALIHYVNAYTINKNIKNIEEQIAYCYYYTNDMINAISMFEKLQSKKSTPEINNLIGLSFLKLKSYVKAKSYFRQATLIDKNFGIGYFNLGTTHYLLNEFEEAIDNLLKANVLLKNDADVCKYLAKAYGKNNDKANAIIFFNKAISLKADVNDVYQLGTLYYEMNQYTEAITQFELALKQGKSKSETSYNLGLCYMGLQNYNEALQLFTESLEGSTDEITVLYNMGNAYLQMKDYKNAILKLEQCIAIDPNYAKAYYLLGFSKYNIDKLHDAKEAFIRAHALDPKFEMPDMIK